VNRAARYVIEALSLVVVAMALYVGYAKWQRHRAQARAADAALAADTTRAHFDTSHAATLSRQDSVKLLGDSLAIVQRLLVQRAQRQDDLDRALALQRIALVGLTAQVRQLVARSTASAPTTEDTSGTRRSHFDVRQTPYTLAADVTLPRPPGRGDMAVRVTLDPATIGLRLGCSAANAQGIRSATATATGPAWLPLTLGRVEQSPELCASPALASKPALRWWQRIEPHVTAGYGVTRAGDGTLVTGPTIAASVDLWRPF
jgi:predicted nucleic acid-binding Zn ribbon protein